MVLLLFALANLSYALPGVLVGPPDAVLLSDESLVVVSRPSEGTLITVTARVHSEDSHFGWILPVPEPVDPLDVALLKHDYLEQFERFSAPRREHIRCEHLSEVAYYPVAPGCGSYEIEVTGITSTDGRVEALPFEDAFATGDYTTYVVEDALAWLGDRGWSASPQTADALALHAASGKPFVVADIVLDAAPTGGAWLEPIQVPLTTREAPIPLALGAPSLANHDLTLIAMGAVALAPELANPAPLSGDCMIRGDFATAYEAQVEVALDAGGEGAWALEFSGSSAACTSCARPPLETYNLNDFGIQSVEAHITRWRRRTGAGSTPADVILIEDEVPDLELRYVGYRESLEFAYPSCDRGWVSDPGVCPGLEPEKRSSAGCDIAGLPGWFWLALAPLVLLRRRTAGAALALLALGGSFPAAAASVEVVLEAPILSSTRVRPISVDQGLPRLFVPLLGGEVRVGIAHFKRMDLALTAGLRGFRGRARGEDTRFSFTEPHAGLDASHGRHREGALISPRFRYGLHASVGILDSAVFTPKSTVAALMHIGGGVTLGRGPQRALVELRASIVPRTDAYVVSFHPATQLEGWTYYPGSSTLTLLLGVDFE